MKNLTNLLLAETWNINAIWFQQYNTNDIHGWHNHPDCMYSNIYFLDLKNKNDATEFFNPIKNMSFKIEGVEEGTMITMPSHILHRSPSTSSSSKTVIAFNSDIYDYNNSVIEEKNVIRRV
jgi:hypothetical protein